MKRKSQKNEKVIYVGPEVGSNKDVEYILVLSGKVSNKKPSFASNDEITDMVKDYDSGNP